MATKTMPFTEKEAAVYFWELFNSNVLPMATWKSDGTFTSVNDAFLKLIGYSRPEYEQGKVNWRRITPPGYEQADEKCIQELKATGHARPLVKEYTHKNGSRVSIHIHNIMVNREVDHGLAIFLSA
jgi:PAS domain S-box-containing protein